MEQFTKDKKRTAVVLLSLAASLSVYLCIVTMLDSQAARTIVSNYMDTDMVIQNDTACKEKSEDSIPYGKEKDEYQNHPENFGSSLIGIDEQEFDYLNNSLEHPINKGDFRSGKACIVYRNGLDLADADIIGKNVTCALYEDQQTTKTFTIEGITDENYYTALLGYPPTIIACDQVVKTFANHGDVISIVRKYLVSGKVIPGVTDDMLSAMNSTGIISGYMEVGRVYTGKNILKNHWPIISIIVAILISIVITITR